jgi:hypothetical protein
MERGIHSAMERGIHFGLVNVAPGGNRNPRPRLAHWVVVAVRQQATDARGLSIYVGGVRLAHKVGMCDSTRSAILCDIG